MKRVFAVLIGHTFKDAEKVPDTAFSSVTHVPGANEHCDHVWFRLFRVLVLHLLKQLAEGLPFLEKRIKEYIHIYIHIYIIAFNYFHF